MSIESGRRLKALRKQKGWTQAELARRIGVKVQNIPFYESGREPGYRVLMRCADLFGVSVNHLVGWTKNDTGADAVFVEAQRLEAIALLSEMEVRMEKQLEALCGIRDALIRKQYTEREAGSG